MSNTQFAFINKEKIPDRISLQSFIEKLGFDLKLDPDFTPLTDEGFSPCILNGESDIGFEIYYEPAADIIEEDEKLDEIAGGRDFCISFVWRGSMKDCASAMIVCAALAKFSDAVISYEGEEPETFESLMAGAQQAISQDFSEPETPHSKIEEEDEYYSNEDNVKKDYDLTIDSTIGAKILKIAIDKIVTNKIEIYVAFDNFNWIYAPDWRFDPEFVDDIESLKGKAVKALYQEKSTLICELAGGPTIRFNRKDIEMGYKTYAQIYSAEHKIGFEVHWRGPFIAKSVD